MTAKTSIHTAHKMEAFRKIIAWHIIITDAARGSWVRKRWPFKQDYIYIDLYAGPGHYQCQDYTGNGSPLIALQELKKAMMPHMGVLFNIDADECQTLQGSLSNNQNATIINADNQAATDYLQCFNNQFGLAYFDPNHVHFDFRLGRNIAQCLPKVDLLFYLSGRYEKLTRNSPNTPKGEGHFLLEKMGMLNKENWFVYSLHSKFQYTFLLGTNANPSGWAKERWHKVDSPQGQTTLALLNWTNNEILSGHALQLGFDLEK
jgi:three-Cys-motif partner protein